MKGIEKMARLKIQKKKNNGMDLRDTYYFDNYLSLKSKGLLSLFYTFDTNVSFTMNDLAALCTDPIGAIRSSLRELQTLGYIQRRMARDERGRFLTVEYILCSMPQKRPFGGDLYC